MENYHIFGEHEEDGVYHSDDFPAHHIAKVSNFAFNEDDILIATYPKAGTTWMQELVYLIVTDADIKRASNIDLIFRSPFLELDIPGKYNGLDVAERLQGQRVLKTHLYYRIFKNTFKKIQPKTIVVFRNLKDNLVSFYHFYRAMPKYAFPGTFEQFVDLFKEKKLSHGDWFDFNLEWWENKEDPKILFLTYEEMKKDIRSVINRICRFLNKKLSDEKIAKIIKRTSFSSMKENPTLKDTVKLQGMKEDISPFMRKGQVGDSSNYFTAELQSELDTLVLEKLEGSGFHFYTKS